MNLPNMKDARKRTNDKVLIDSFKIDDKYKNLGLNKKYYIRTYGCQMNEHDTENIKAILELAKFEETDTLENADLVILNTCAIRENAHDKVFGLLGRIKHLKQTKPELIAGICGCMAQEESVVDEILNKYKYLDFVFGTHNLDNCLEIINNAIIKKTTQVEVYSMEGNIVEGLPAKRDSKYKAWVNIMLGCDKFCTYCIVPYTRGKQRSRTHESIVEEVKELVKEGYKEVTLLGQNVNAYGKDLYNDYTLADLLLDVSNTNIERIRFVTSHPWDFTDEMIDVIASRDNIMPYIHLPIQSGSNKVLKLMGRRYTKEEYLTLFNKIKEKIKNVCITTDIIVGFPNETEEDFLETLNVVNTCKFDGAFTFIYSPRENTPAAKMEQIDENVKKERLQRLNKIVNKYSKESNERFLNKEAKVLIEDYSDKGKNMYKGYTENMKLVNVLSEKNIIGEIVNVKINEVKSFSLNGIIEEI